MKKINLLHLFAAFCVFSLPACDVEKETASIVKPVPPTGRDRPPVRKAPATAPTPSEKKHDEEVKKAILVRFTNSVQLDEALKLAKAYNKPVFVDCYTDWCAPCKLMDEYVFTEPVFANYMNANFIPYKFDGANFDADPFIKKYKIQGYPTLLFIAPNGKVISSYFGGLSHSAMKKMAQEALAKHRSGV